MRRKSNPSIEAAMAEAEGYIREHRTVLLLGKHLWRFGGFDINGHISEEGYTLLLFDSGGRLWRKSELFSREAVRGTS